MSLKAFSRGLGIRYATLNPDRLYYTTMAKLVKVPGWPHFHGNCGSTARPIHENRTRGALVGAAKCPLRRRLDQIDLAGLGDEVDPRLFALGKHVVSLTHDPGALPGIGHRAIAARKAPNFAEPQLAVAKLAGHQKTAFSQEAEHARPCFGHRRRQANHATVALQEDFLEREGVEAAGVQKRGY